jgi:hypothetical protein
LSGCGGLPKGVVSVAALESSLNWSRQRCTKVLETLVREGLVWVHEDQGDRTFWFLGIVNF